MFTVKQAPTIRERGEKAQRRKRIGKWCSVGGRGLAHCHLPACAVPGHAHHAQAMPRPAAMAGMQSNATRMCSCPEIGRQAEAGHASSHTIQCCRFGYLQRMVEKEVVKCMCAQHGEEENRRAEDHNVHHVHTGTHSGGTQSNFYYMPTRTTSENKIGSAGSRLGVGN